MRTLLVAAVLLLVVSTSAEAVDRIVPDQFGTITAALAASSSGDDVLVRAGTYTEMLMLVDGVDLISFDGAATTTIDAGGGGRVIDADAVVCTVEGFTIVDGFAPTNGAGMRVWNAANVTVTDCIFDNNTASGQGGGMAVQDAQATITGCQFVNNSAGSGAGMLISGSALADVRITDSSFFDNTASGGMGSGSGGAILGSNTSFTMADCMVYDNSAAAIGGAIGLDSSNPNINDTTFFGNMAVEGGAISYHNSSAGSLTRCTFYENDATLGGAISCTNASSPSVIRCIIASQTNGGALRCAVGSTPTIGCVNLWNNLGGNGDAICGTDQGGNISVDPQFCRLDPTLELNFTLQADSPCAAAQAPCSMQMGSGGVGCGVTAVQVASWGQVKATYR